MRLVSLLTLAVALGSIATLAACAGSSPGPTALVPSASSPGTAKLRLMRREASPLTCDTTRRLRARVAHGGFSKPATSLQRYLYVVDACGPAVDVLRAGKYDELGYISNGVIEPSDAFVDSNGNLYVADQSDVTEYAPGNWNAPSFTYNANAYVPFAVTTDANGNVYEADEGSSSDVGVINEYYQNRNVAIASCAPLNGEDLILGIAVDSQNDVFASVFDYSTEAAELVEYRGGLNNCSSLTVLPLAGAGFGGLALDKNGNLLIANLDGVVDVVDAPSYSSVNATIGSGFCAPDNVRLNRSNKLAFVTDICNNNVTVVNYPSGTNRTVLGTGNGLSEPYAAVEAPNAVY
jgi:hypothetical protein